MALLTDPTNRDIQPSARVLFVPSAEACGQESASPRMVNMMYAAAKVARSCVLFISSLCFVHRVVAVKDARPEPARVEASASCTTEKPLRGRGSSFSSSGWRKLIAGCLLYATFTMRTMLSYFLDTIAGDGRSSSNLKATSPSDNSAMHLFQRGYVQAIQVAASNNIVYYKARCEPEMKSTVSYQMKLGVEVVRGSGGHAKCVTQVMGALVQLVKHHMHHANTSLSFCMPWRNSAG